MKALLAILFCLFLVQCAPAEEFGIFEPFKITNPAGIEYVSAFARCKPYLLKEPVPQPALDYIYGVTVDESGVTNSIVTDKTLEEVSLKVWRSLDGTEAIVWLGAQEFAVGRNKPVKPEQAYMWLQYLTPYGYGIDTWLTQDTALEIIRSPKYTILEDEQ